MKISGTTTLRAPVDQVWQAMLDPATLAQCIPGCESLTMTGENRYAMTVTAGVAAIKGTYAGEVALLDLEPPGSLTLRASGSGAPGTVEADARVQLAPTAAGGTELSYDADAAVGGTIGGVGQRMLAGVSKKMAGQFFSALDEHIATGGVGSSRAQVPHHAAYQVSEVNGGPTHFGEQPSSGAVFSGKASGAGGGDGDKVGFVAGVAVGGLMALIGVLVGARIGGRNESRTAKG